jgi:glyoxylase-like metal-dependent hydrolase (beta-lactamase superfamily II)
MIHTIDLHFQGLPENIAAFLVETSSGPILVETGPHSTLPQLKAGVEAAGFRMEDIKHVFLTHIHLDHAGAAWWFAARGATIYVHPRGSKHLASPGRLMESARMIYQDKMETLWGQMNEIAEGNIIVAADGEVFSFNKEEEMKAWHTPGHAVHHIAWQFGEHIFTGDVAGVRIRQGVVIPPCPPPDIDIADWVASIAVLRRLKPAKFYLTHFGEVAYSDDHLDELEQRLKAWANWIKPHVEAGKTIPETTPLFQQMVKEDLMKAGISAGSQAKYESANPSWMSVAGLFRYWKKQGR